MRLHRNDGGQVKVPSYQDWATFEVSMVILGLFLGQAYQSMKHHLGYNDWQMREAVRKWAQSQTDSQETTEGST